MSQKAMVFIDGGWLYRSRTTLFAKLGEENFEIDYAKLPKIFCEDVANRLDEDISLVRTNYFGTIPSARSGFNTSKQYAFYDFLERSCGYETEIHEVDVGTDENWIKMSLASSLLYYAAQPGAFDIALLIGDDPDYAPVLRRARLFGKRIQVVGAHDADGKEPPPAATLASRSRVADFPLLWIDDHASEVRLVRERVTRVCKQCGREEETTWAGPEFFCVACRGRHRK